MPNTNIYGLKQAYPDKISDWCKKGGKASAKKIHELYPDLALNTCHIRWHIKRGIVNPNCKLCRGVKQNVA